MGLNGLNPENIQYNCLQMMNVGGYFDNQLASLYQKISEKSQKCIRVIPRQVSRSRNPTPPDLAQIALVFIRKN